MDISEWKQQQEKKGCPPYSHFDDKVSLKRVWNKISNPIYITHHSFYPFIHYQLRNRKVKNGVGQKPKIRDIYYASHWDSWIYRYYSFLLNEKYNEQLNKKKIGNVVAAYRTSLGKSNINFAYDAFDFLQKHQPCYVLIEDFKDFFDQLDHAYLKKQLCNLMGVEKLPDDYFAVFKNITRFSYCELDEILKDNGLEINKKSRKELFKKRKFCPLMNLTIILEIKKSIKIIVLLKKYLKIRMVMEYPRDRLLVEP